jgi:hypothetical protein
MSSSIQIHSIDTEAGTCIATIRDGEAILVDKKNIGLQLDSNGDADMDYIKSRATFFINNKRNSDTITSSNKLFVHTKDGDINTPNV